jgi:replicative DNA helicase
MPVKFKSMQDAVHETLTYVKGRQEGTITSLRTGFPKLDDTMIDGIEWNSTLTLGGRPSVGKSAVSDCILDGALANNLDENGAPDFDVLDFNWELSSRVMLLRRLSAKMKRSYKYIISAEKNTITAEELEQIQSFLVDHYGSMPITFCEQPLSTKEFADTVRRFVDKNKKKTLVRLDHTLLAKKSASQASQVEMLLNLLMEANELKKEYPIIFMILNQINREFEDRQENATDKAFPRQGDVYGGDAAAMFSETMILLNAPQKYGVTFYGNKASGISVMDDDLFLHVVKNRNAEGIGYLHYKSDFKNMSIKEY